MKTNLGFRYKFNIDFIRAISKDNTINYADFGGLRSTSYTTKNKPTVPGQFVADTIPVFDKNNGNTYKLFEANTFPEKIEFKYSVESAADPLRKPDFVLSNTKADIYIKVKVPLRFNAGSKLEYKQTIKDVDKSFKQFFKDETIDKAYLALQFSNGMPLHAKLKIIFTDSLVNPITTTFISEYNIAAPVVDSKSGTVVNARKQMMKIEINKSQIKEIKKAKNVDFEFTVDGKDENGIERPVNIELSNSFGVKLGLFVKGNTTVNLGSTM